MDLVLAAGNKNLTGLSLLTTVTQWLFAASGLVALSAKLISVVHCSRLGITFS